jgi:hypothetical protein
MRRKQVDYRHEARREHSRFRKDPEHYLRALEEQLSQRKMRSWKKNPVIIVLRAIVKLSCVYIHHRFIIVEHILSFCNRRTLVD